MKEKCSPSCKGKKGTKSLCKQCKKRQFKVLFRTNLNETLSVLTVARNDSNAIKKVKILYPDAFEAECMEV